MQVIIAGATGFIGQQLIKTLLQHDYEVIALSRNEEFAYSVMPASVKVIGWKNKELREAISSSQIVINLAGESIAGGRWTKKKKVAIINSRLHSAQRLANAIKSIDNKNILYVQASAVGFYGDRADELCNEYDAPGDGFLADVCKKWESYVPAMEEQLERVLTLRLGVVLGKDGGFLSEIRKQAKRHMAGVMGTGKQWISWIHIYDLIYAIMYLINSDEAKGVYNLVAPEPLRQKDMFRLISKNEKRRIQLPTPEFIVKSLLGEMGQELILSGQKVSGAKLYRQGFVFKYNTAEIALDEILR
jgi:uncharacterized protein (TIGR01777 family)